MNEKILTPDDVIEWMQCSRRAANKMIRQVKSHWHVGVKRGENHFIEPRVLESEMIKMLRQNRNFDPVPKPVGKPRVIQFEIPKTAKQIHKEYFAKRKKK